MYIISKEKEHNPRVLSGSLSENDPGPAEQILPVSTPTNYTVRRAVKATVLGVKTCGREHFFSIFSRLAGKMDEMVMAYFNTLTSGHVERRSCSPMRC
jgi:hypothetical protein